MASNTQSSKRHVDGMLLLDKPAGITSNAALQEIKRLFQAKKAGHGGSLDPLATGMLPICFGRATKLSQGLLTADKSYVVTAKLGVKTTTSDAEGEIISERPVPEISKADLDQRLDRFRGVISQIPSMYSALKYKGQPLYKLARQGITVERKPRELTIHKLCILDLSDDLMQLEIHCSKGTYVRTLVDDIGEMIGCGAHVIALRRFRVGDFKESDLVTYEHLFQYRNDLEELDKFLLLN